MNRHEATRRLMKHLKDDIVVASLGNPADELAAVAPGRPQNFYTRSGMGLASSVGLGLATVQPGRKVVVLDGDGSLLMNLGSLSTIGAMAPRNLIHIVWDNEQYQLTGGQTTHTGRRTDLAAMARAAGYRQVGEPRTEDEFEKVVVETLASDGPAFLLAKIGPEQASGKYSWDGVVLKIDFMRGIGTME